MPFSDCYNGAASAALCMAARRAGRGGRAWPGGTIDEARRLLRAGGGWCRDSAISAPYNGAAAAAFALAARRVGRDGHASAPATMARRGPAPVGGVRGWCRGVPFSGCYNSVAAAALCMVARRAGRGGRARPAGTIGGAAVYSVPLAASRLRVRQVPSSMPVADGSPPSDSAATGPHRPENGLTRIASDVV